jgi:hypothetical protein
MRLLSTVRRPELVAPVGCSATSGCGRHQPAQVPAGGGVVVVAAVAKMVAGTAGSVFGVRGWEKR